MCVCVKQKVESVDEMMGWKKRDGGRGGGKGMEWDGLDLVGMETWRLDGWMDGWMEYYF
ncbi:predicted protein [Sclerotinia sclerotiorum 1980 UF-70]|uniref:Uncharacterized protein n=1 Tax=Sclerotinia sclerotiorum (strain ATCC 18683 / 1980 / Ss-1) TaxID=665079 RepID=A7F220_SCLS1|nr:predicted protein [Sclerotinia sclerotiorum 1980 UF-70]EDN95762.1 predicted protein [Sclerotinia sclerotiorum 1980 UF-70]